MNSTLHECARNGDLQECRRLIDQALAGHDVDALNINSESPLYLACLYSHQDIVKLLLEHRSETRTNSNIDRYLHIAVDNGHKDITQLLLHHGANPNKRISSNGGTLVHWVILPNEIQYLKLLLEYDGDPNLQNYHGHTPLHLAIKYNKEQCISLLLDYRAEPTILDNDGHTAKDIIDRTDMVRYQRIVDVIDSYEFPVKNAEY